MLVIRDGHAVVKSPAHEAGDTVPEDLLILFGVAASFRNPGFRSQALTAAQRAMEHGDFDGIIDFHKKLQ